MSGGLEPPQWPPRSPYEAIISSPSGKHRLQQRQTRLSLSPSPLRRSAAVLDLKSSAKSNKVGNHDDLDDEDEDEETLQLRLQALETKLRLKKLQSKKAKATGDGSNSETSDGEGRSKSRSNAVPLARRESKIPSGSRGPKTSSDIEVPASPEKRKPIVQEQRSPSRVLLGIDKGLSGRNVSLRRPPNLNAQMSQDLSLSQDLGTKSHIRTRPGRRGDNQLTLPSDTTSGKSFNERMAQHRERLKQQTADKERREQLRKERSTGFGVRKEEIEAFRTISARTETASQSQSSQSSTRSFSRHEVLKGIGKAEGRPAQTSQPPSSVQLTDQIVTSVSIVPNDRGRPRSAAAERLSSLQDKRQPATGSSASIESLPSTRPDTPGADASLFEPFSSSNLTRRILPHTFLQRTLENKTPVLIPRLLRDVKAPDFALPDPLIENDFVVFAIIASKSAPIAHKENQKTRTFSKEPSTSHEEADNSTANERGKFMILTLTDLKWTVDLYLFTTAYTRFRKLMPGTVVAILNPNVMPPPRHKTDTGRWSLSLSSSDDTILEIGTAKDLAWCKAVKKDGNPCGDWVDCRKTDFCDFHVSRQVDSTRRGRLEVNGMSAPFGPGGKRGGGRFGRNTSKAEGGGAGYGDDWGRDGKGGLKGREGRQYSRSTQSTYYLSPAAFGGDGPSAAELLDLEDSADRGGKQERERRMRAERERESEIARKLSLGGHGAGAAYLKARQVGSAAQAQESESIDTTIGSGGEVRDALSLGLRGNKAGEVTLSPLKRKRPEGVSVTGGTVKKKTRFITANGIREAGRESLGTTSATAVGGDGDDCDDDLVII